MTVRSVYLSGAAFAVLIIGAPLGAEVSASPNAPQAKDPNEKICVKVVNTGSRAKSGKECATRAEWEERRLRSQVDIGAAQRDQDSKRN